MIILLVNTCRNRLKILVCSLKGVYVFAFIQQRKIFPNGFFIGDQCTAKTDHQCTTTLHNKLMFSTFHDKLHCIVLLTKCSIQSKKKTKK